MLLQTQIVFPNEMSALNPNILYHEYSTKVPEKIVEFYKHLGFESNQFGDYVQVVFGGKVNSRIGFRKTEDAISGLNSFYIHVDDPQAAFDELATKDLNPTAVSNEIWGHPATSVKDPEGRLLVFTKQVEE